jgi:hypothetical protein
MEVTAALDTLDKAKIASKLAIKGWKVAALVMKVERQRENPGDVFGMSPHTQPDSNSRLTKRQ